MRSQDVLVLIPARGGSKGIPHKNMVQVAGRPLISHTIAQALAATQVTRIVVSTDDKEISAVSQESGAEVIFRPPSISGDLATSESALAHALAHLRTTERYEPDLVVFLQCTAPVRELHDIDRAIDALRSKRADSLLSVTESHRFLWADTGGVVAPINYDFKNRPRRQDMAKQYVENGSIYVFKTEMFNHTGNRLGGKIALYVMSEDAAWDIDSPFDMRIAELFLSKFQEKAG